MNRRNFVAGCIATALLPVAVSTQVAETSIASDFVGPDWLRWDVTRKLFDVWGFRAGQNSAAVTVLDPLSIPLASSAGRKVEARVSVAASVAQIVAGTDVVSGDFRNQSLPLWVLVTHVIESIGGLANDQSLDAVRQRYGSPQARPEQP